VHAPQRPVEFFPDPLERRVQRRPPPDQHVIMARLEPSTGRQPDDLPQTTPNSVSLYRVADPLGNGKSDANRPILATMAHL